MVLYGGAGYVHVFERTVNAIAVQPGDRIHGNFGVGFAINDEVTISGAIMGEHQFATALNQQKVVGSALDPVSINTGVTLRLSKNQYLDPSVTFGVTEDANDVLLGLSWSLKIK